MKIIFLCGSLEPGRNGVGDYTRRLAAELTRQGVEVAALAFNDPFVGENYEGEQEQEGIYIPVLRMGAEISKHKRIKTAKEWITGFKPEWLSLQFVPYSFHKKGLPWRLPGELVKIGRGVRWHIMFHELWVEGDNYKRKLLEFLQKQIIINLVSRLEPAVIHTSLPVYKRRLDKIGVKAEKLPIFSNLRDFPVFLNGYHREFTIAFFSQFTPEKSVIDYLKVLTRKLFIEDMEFKLLLIGGDHSGSCSLVKELRKIPGANRRIKYSGFLDEFSLIKLIRACNLGITPVPRHVLGKSGSVAAFLSQGIPVAAPFIKSGYEDLQLGLYSDNLKKAIVKEPDLVKIRKAAEMAKKVSKEIHISKVANKFMADLDKNYSAEDAIIRDFLSLKHNK